MSALYQRPDWVTRINYYGDSLRGAENLVAIDSEEMIEAAMRITGLSDFGEGDWREAYQKMVEAIASEARLHVLGRLMTRGEIIRCLCTRLWLMEKHRADPDLAGTTLDRPVFICGPSRSGTTILHELLALDPQLRAPMAWETLHPIPRPDLVTNGEDRRPSVAECEQELWEDIQPEFAAIHVLRSRLPMECLTIMAPQFTSGHWSTVLDVPDFLSWRGPQDSIDAYRFHRLFMQVLQAESWSALPDGQPKPRWVFKSPVHIGHFKNLFSVYPDARVIHTHRDPVKVLPSTVSTVKTTRFTRSDHVRLDELATNIAFGFEFMLKQTIEERRTGVVPDEQIADIHFKSLMRDPVAAIARTYEALGLVFTDAFAGAITDYLAAKPQGKHGKHSYSLADYGLDETQVRQAYSAYCDYYGVEQEAV